MKLQQKLRLALIITVAIIFTGAIPTTGYAKDNDDFVIKDGILTDYVGTETKITIPSNVKEIGVNAFRENSVIEEVTIPGNVKVIGQFAFLRCINLKTVTIKSGVETLEIGAFAEDLKLSKVTIPKSVVRIKADNFQDSLWLKNDKRQFMIEGNGILIDYKGNSSKVTLPSSVKGIGSNAFSSVKNKLTQIVMNRGLKKISDDAFYGYSKLKTVSIPSSVTYIGPYTFADTPWLKNNKNEYLVVGNGILIKYGGNRTKAVLPSNVRTINEAVFYKNKKLTEIVLNNKLTEIKDCAFLDCKKLKKINIPSSVKAIGSDAFTRTALTSVSIPKKTTTIGSSAFSYCANLTQVSFAKDSKLKVIEAGLFTECKALKKVELPSSVTEIGMDAFLYCTKLKSINLPNTLTKLADWAFRGCSSLTTVKLPDKITIVPSYSFDGCSSLIKVSLSGKVTTIGESAFNNCSKLSDFTLPSSVKSIGAYAFCNCTSLESIKINSNIKELPSKSFNGCTNLENIEVDIESVNVASDALTGTKWMNSIDGDFFILKGKLISYKGAGDTVTVPDTVNTIEDRAFADNAEITEVILPSSIKNIGDESFHGCSKLKKVVLPYVVNYIGKHAFENCELLEEVTIDDKGSMSSNGNAVLSTFAFGFCPNLKKVILPDNITDMEDNVFFNCKSLSEIKLPDQLKNLGSNAFDQCSSLAKVSFNGTLNSIGFSVFTSTPYYTQSKDNMLALQNVLLKYNGSDKSLTLPESYTIIDSKAFYNNTTLEEIKLPNSIKYLGGFSGCTNLKTIKMPSTPFDLGNGAFYGTQWLQDQKDSFVILNGTLIKYQGTDRIVTIPDTVTKIATGAFSDSNIDKVVISKSVKKIDSYAFAYSNVKEVYIEEGVEEIGDNAFEECMRLKLIHIPDSVSKIGGNLVFCEEDNTSYIIECSKGSKAYEYAVSQGIRVRLR